MIDQKREFVHFLAAAVDGRESLIAQLMDTTREARQAMIVKTLWLMLASLRLLVLLLALLCAIVVWHGTARADTPISKCWQHICAEPQVATTTLVYRPGADSLAIAIPAGAAGYGVRLPSGYASAGLFLDAAVGTGGAQSYLGIAVLGTVMRAVSLGVVLHLVGERWVGLALGWSATSELGLEAEKAERWE